MELVLREQDGVDYGFVEYLVNEIIPKRFNSLLDKKKLKKWDDYFFKDKSSEFNLGNLKSTEAIVEFGINSLSISSYNGYYTIGISYVEKIIGTNTKISTVCRLINYGNSDVSGYMIFSDVFKTVKRELKLYQNMYMLGIR